MDGESHKVLVCVGAGLIAQADVAGCAASNSEKLKGILFRTGALAQTVADNFLKSMGHGLKVCSTMAEVVHQWHQGIIENFATSLAGQKRPCASEDDALVAHHLIDAAMRSARAGSRKLLDS